MAKAKKPERLTPVPARARATPQGKDKQRGTPLPEAPADDLSHIAPGLRHLAVPIGDLNFHPKNPRKHNEANIAAIRGSLRVNGQYRPAVISRRTGQAVVIVGNGILAAALAENWTHLAAEPMELTEAKENQLAITDNETAALADWDQDILAAVLRDVNTENDHDLDRMLAELAEDVGIVDMDQGDGSNSASTPLTVVATCTDREQQDKLFAELQEQGYAVQMTGRGRRKKAEPESEVA